MKPIVVIGSINQDIRIELDRLPIPGETFPLSASPIRLEAREPIRRQRLPCLEETYP